MDILRLISFNIADEEYGFDITFVQSIERLLPITRVPNCREFVKGVLNLRGTVIPVVDLRSRIGLGEISYSDKTRIVITKVESTEIGFLVEETNEVITTKWDSIETPPSDQFDYIQGIAKYNGRLISLLDITKLIGETADESSVSNQIAEI